MSFVKIAENFDRTQAFAAGFALAGKELSLSQEEYATMCKLAAEMLGVPPPAPPATPATTQGVTAPVVPITTPEQARQAERNSFVAQKAQLVQNPKAAASNWPKNAAELATQPLPKSYDPAGTDQLNYGAVPPAKLSPQEQSIQNAAAQNNVKPVSSGQATGVRTATPLPAKPATQPKPSPGAIAPGLAQWLKNPTF